MNRDYVLSGALMTGAIALTTIQPAWAAITRVTAVRINPVGEGLELTLATQGEGSGSDAPQMQRPQVFTVNHREVWIADVVNTTLNLGGANHFQQDNPAPGIASVVVSQVNANSIRIAVTGISGLPTGQLLQQRQQAMVFGIHAGSDSQAAVPNAAISPTIFASSSSEPSESPEPSNQTTTPASPNVLVPNPEIRIENTPGSTTAPSPPLSSRAIAPPVGDIAVSNTNTPNNPIDLGTQEIIPRLVLREAPVREVLSLLARAAGLNLAFDEGGAIATPNTSPVSGAPGSLGASADASMSTISLDIENEPIQNVFNYVLQLTGLEANRRGRTIFVGARLPNAARDVISRSLRMNQVTVGVALNFLVGLGAESAVSRERLITSVNAVAISSLEASAPPIPAVTQTQTTTEQRLETQRVNYEDSEPPLRGLLVLGDERTNSVTLVGSAHAVEMASAQLAQLDVRRRQASVNVRVIDVNLSAIEDFSGSFSFGINDTTIRGIPAATLNNAASVVFNGNGTNGFTATLEAQIRTGNAKILTDPTLIVQEGQTATVALTQEVQTTTGTTTTSGSTGNTIAFQQDKPRAAGLTLAIEINRIDDNGFVALSVAPTITAPADTQTNPDGSTTTLLSARSLQSGQIRLRDGQTLILSGIIQDSDRSTVTKVPILGDIPILGALFRSTDRQNQRREVVVLLTPQIIDDSQTSTFGYGYIPGSDAQQLMQR